MKKNSTFYHLVRPSHSFRPLKKILLKMFAMLIKNSLYISGVFIKISKMCSKMAYNNNKKRFKQHIHLNFSLKGHFFECFISFKTCYAFEFYISTEFKKKKKNLLCRKKKKKKKKKTYYVEEEKKYLIEKWKWKQQKKWKENCT